MNNKPKYAFAVMAHGERYIEYRSNLVSALRKYVQSADIVDIDVSDVMSALEGVDEKRAIELAPLSIPILDKTRSYERVVWIDSDSDVLSEGFSEIFVVETSNDGLAAAVDAESDSNCEYIKSRIDGWIKNKCFNAGLVVFDIGKIDRNSWCDRIEKAFEEELKDPFKGGCQYILNGYFDISEIESRFNTEWRSWRNSNGSERSLMIHYSGDLGHDALDEIIQIRNDSGLKKDSWKDRCIVISPRHDFIRPWIRAYFATGNMTPLVIVPGPPGDWKDGDEEYCRKAVEFCGGMIFDCASEWENSKRLAERAVRKSNVGWFTKKSILHAVATKLAPREWAWIDDDAEVTGSLDECFEAASRAPGFIFTQFYYPSSIDNCHPARFYRSNIDTGDKVCWNSLVFFHGDANDRISEELGKDFPVEDDEIVFGHLYQTNKSWHEGFCDFSIRNWQANCKLLDQIPKSWSGKLLHYTTNRNGGEVKKMWAAKACTLPKAPFEKFEPMMNDVKSDDAVDAVFVIGTGSIDGNEELRYALRNLDRNCKFVRNVYICGFCPSWVDKSVVRHLKWPDRFSHAKDANIIDKLRHACEFPGIAKRILFCSDDQFQTRECTWDDFAPRYLRRYSSSDGWYESRNRVWHTRLRKTMERDVQRRRSAGLDANNVFYYQPHIWMPIDRDVFIEYARWCGYERREDTIIASGYYNYADVDGKPDFDHSFIGGNASSVPKTTHIAYHDGSYQVAIKILRDMFPEKCRFEIDPSAKKNTSESVRPVSEVRVVSGNVEKTECSINDDPSPAGTKELGEIIDVSRRIRENPSWHSLLGEVSRAEELRLFGVRGWRTVWNDIIGRWREATCNGTDYVPVESKRSFDAASVVNSYIQNPNAMRTVRFGTPSEETQSNMSAIGRKLPRPANGIVRASLRDRIRTSLR